MSTQAGSGCGLLDKVVFEPSPELYGQRPFPTHQLLYLKVVADADCPVQLTANDII